METHVSKCERQQVEGEKEEELEKEEVYTLLDAAGECRSLDASAMSRLCQMILIHSTAQPIVTG